MRRRLEIYLLLLVGGLLTVGCRQAKYVEQGNYLLKKNNLLIAAEDKSGQQNWASNHPLLDESELSKLMRPAKNSGLRLFVYNRIDTGRYQRQLSRKRAKFQKKSERRQQREDQINEKRIAKSKKKGRTHYKRKTKSPISMRSGWRHWLLTHWGQAPVVLDTAKIAKTRQQMSIFLHKKGFKQPSIADTVVYDNKKRYAVVNYHVKPGKAYRIASIQFDQQPRNKDIYKQYKRMVRKEGTAIKVGELLDEDKLESEREHLTQFLKDNAFYRFTKNYINFIVDTSIGNHQANVVLYIKEKRLDSIVRPHLVYKVKDVIFKLHNTDSLSFKDFQAYKARCEEQGKSVYDPKEGYPLLDTLFIVDTVLTKYRMTLNANLRKSRGVKPFERGIDTAVYYKGIFVYNEAPYVSPRLLDRQNFLEHEHFAKDYYVGRSYTSLLRLDIFSRIAPKLEAVPNDPHGRYLNAVYDLTPGKRQQLTLEPRATNTNSILGVSAGLSYTNYNLTGRANQLIVSITGGFQSQPLVGGEAADESRTFRFRGLNTFEWGPEITYKIPRFFPMSRKMEASTSKRSFPSTEISVLYNFQNTKEFERHVSSVRYAWKFSSPNQTQLFSIVPLRADYVKIEREASFDSTLSETNDPAFTNSYSDFFSLGLFNFSHHYNNAKKKKINRKTLHVFDNLFEMSASGLVVSAFHAMASDSLSYAQAFRTEGKSLFKVPYAQYIKLQNTWTVNQYLAPKHRMVYRLLTGIGVAYANSISLPYTESFTAGGSNDIRAFPTRTMAPGETKTYADENATTTQIGDMKLTFNLEWRFQMSGMFHGAIFADMGNIWKVRAEEGDVGRFAIDSFYKQIALGTGFGLRADLEFLIVRLDLSWPLYNPYLPAGNRWWLAADHTEYKSYFKEVNGELVDYIPPHGPQFNIGIGYPF